MSETIDSTIIDSVSPDERERDLSAFLTFLERLYERSGFDVTQPQQRNKILLNELSPFSRKNLLFALRETHRRLLRRCITDPQHWTSERAKDIEHAISEKKIKTAISSRWHDHILSTPGHDIQYQRYGWFLIQQKLMQLITEKASPQSLQHIGWISFDMNGLKSLIDCTNHQNGHLFLQNTARVFLTHKNDTTIPLTAGGDEFALLIRTPDTLSPQYLAKIIAGYQQDITNSLELQRAINFEDPKILMRYGGIGKKERELLSALPPDECRQDLQTIRDELPPIFTPSISGGAATLEEGVLFALQREDEHRLQLDLDLETFESASEKAIMGMLSIADARESAAKATFKKDLEVSNPKLADFLRRNRENRDLAQRLRLKRQQIQDLLAHITKLQTTGE